MKVKTKLALVMIFITLFNFTLKTNFGDSTNTETIQHTFFTNVSTLPYEKSINNFSDFNIYINNSYIQTLNSVSNISLNYYGGANETSIGEYYAYSLEDNEYCTDFIIQMDLDYNYTGYSMLGRMQIMLSSKYDAYGNFVGTLENNTKNDFCYASIYDAWNSNGGVFSIGAAPLNIWETYQTQYGSSDFVGKISIVITRTDNILVASIFRNSVSMITRNFGIIYKPVNYILVGGNINTDYNNFTEVTFSNLNANMTIDIPEFSNPPENDANSGGDAGDCPWEATEIDIGSYTGETRTIGDLDYYRFYVEVAKLVEVEFSGPEEYNFDIRLYDSNYNHLIGSIGETSDEHISYTTPNDNYYILEIYPSDGYGSYTFSITVSEGTLPPPNDAYLGTDAGDSFYNALTVNTNAPYSGVIGYGSDLSDFYQFDIQYEGLISITFRVPHGQDLDIVLYNPHGVIMDSDQSSDYFYSLNKDVSGYVNGAYGYWRFEVIVVSGYGYYTFTITYTITATTTITTPHDNPIGANIGYIIMGILGGLAILSIGIYFGVSQHKNKQQRIQNQSNENETSSIEDRKSSSFLADEKSQSELPPYEEVITDAKGHEKEIIDSIYKGYSFDYEEENQ
ncbi:MAG: PPC domain-containing protein [Candidatus Thorarchaeota archaeon]